MDVDTLTIGELKQLTKLARGIGICDPKAAAKLEEKRVVLVIDRGWIMAGNQSLTSDGYIRLTNAVHVFRWESIGFAKMLEQWRDTKVDVRKIADVEVPKASVIFRVEVPAGWGVK